MEYGKPHQSCPERHTVESQPPWPWRYIRARGHVHLPCGGRVRSVTCLCRIEAYRNASISSWKATICPPAFQVKTRNFVRWDHPHALDETSTLINLCF